MLNTKEQLHFSWLKEGMKAIGTAKIKNTDFDTH